jgi:2-polyprenyl-6-methoxyphenol hydroxylase-like FAD-dependent oxidoreductase
MSERTDVVIVGGGIGGASLAYALAREGLGVTVLEATAEYEDRVRGESMHAWGVKEARELGVEDVMLEAGAHITPVWKQYVEGVGLAGEIPMGMLLPDIPGTLNLRHPVACQALIDAASAVGASVVRGVRDVKISGGTSPVVSFVTDGDTAELDTTLIVGADGRASKGAQAGRDRTRATGADQLHRRASRRRARRRSR